MPNDTTPFMLPPGIDALHTAISMGSWILCAETGDDDASSMVAAHHPQAGWKTLPDPGFAIRSAGAVDALDAVLATDEDGGLALWIAGQDTWAWTDRSPDYEGRISMVKRFSAPRLDIVDRYIFRVHDDEGCRIFTLSQDGISPWGNPGEIVKRVNAPERIAAVWSRAGGEIMALISGKYVLLTPPDDAGGAWLAQEPRQELFNIPDDDMGMRSCIPIRPAAPDRETIIRVDISGRSNAFNLKTGEIDAARGLLYRDHFDILWELWLDGEHNRLRALLALARTAISEGAKPLSFTRDIDAAPALATSRGIITPDTAGRAGDDLEDRRIDDMHWLGWLAWADPDILPVMCAKLAFGSSTPQELYLTPLVENSFGNPGIAFADALFREGTNCVDEIHNDVIRDIFTPVLSSPGVKDRIVKELMGDDPGQITVACAALAITDRYDDGPIPTDSPSPWKTELPMSRLLELLDGDDERLCRAALSVIDAHIKAFGPIIPDMEALAFRVAAKIRPRYKRNTRFQALLTLGHFPSLPEEVIELLRPVAADDPDASIRYFAFEFLTKISPRDVVWSLTTIQGDPGGNLMYAPFSANDLSGKEGGTPLVSREEAERLCETTIMAALAEYVFSHGPRNAFIKGLHCSHFHSAFSSHPDALDEVIQLLTMGIETEDLPDLPPERLYPLIVILLAYVFGLRLKGERPPQDNNAYENGLKIWGNIINKVYPGGGISLADLKNLDQVLDGSIRDLADVATKFSRVDPGLARYSTLAVSAMARFRKTGTAQHHAPKSPLHIRLQAMSDPSTDPFAISLEKTRDLARHNTPAGIAAAFALVFAGDRGMDIDTLVEKVLAPRPDASVLSYFLPLFVLDDEAACGYIERMFSSSEIPPAKKWILMDFLDEMCASGGTLGAARLCEHIEKNINSLHAATERTRRSGVRSPGA